MESQSLRERAKRRARTVGLKENFQPFSFNRRPARDIQLLPHRRSVSSVPVELEPEELLLPELLLSSDPPLAQLMQHRTDDGPGQIFDTFKPEQVEASLHFPRCAVHRVFSIPPGLGQQRIALGPEQYPVSVDCEQLYLRVFMQTPLLPLQGDHSPELVGGSFGSELMQHLMEEDPGHRLLIVEPGQSETLIHKPFLDLHFFTSTPAGLGQHRMAEEPGQ